MRPKRYQKRGRPITQLLGVDSIDTQEYHGHVGDIIRIEPFTTFKVDKVLVAICAEKAGLIEHGLATRQPRTHQWLYAATAENPEKDDWSVAVTAVRRPDPAAPCRFRASSLR